MSSNETMQVFQVCDLHSLLKICFKLRSEKYWSFRGHRNKTWALQPHHNISQEELTSLFKSFNDRIKEFPKPDYLDEDNLWRWLFYAQHYGLKTPLLDWSSNPLVAVYFAVENILSGADDDNDYGCVWVLHVSKDKFRWADELREQPFKRTENDDTPIVDDWLMIKPPPILSRLVRQSGLFTFHPHEKDHCMFCENDTHKEIVKIEIVPKNGVNPSKSIRQSLGMQNLHHAGLFPDPAGVAKFVNYELRDLKPGKIIRD